MRLEDALTAALGTAARAPTAVLALAYAEQIDAAAHVPLAMADALAALESAAVLADESTLDGKVTDKHTRAYRKVAAALAAVTVASDLGPKLLAALDALTLTPKAQAALRQAVNDAAPANPLRRLRDRHADRSLRAVG